MRKKLLYSLLLTIILLVLTNEASFTRTSWAQVNRPQYVPGEVLVKLKTDLPVNQIETLHEEFSTRTLRYFPLIDVFHLKLPASLSVEDAIEALQRHPQVEYVEPNNLYYLDVIPSDPGFEQMWGLNNVGQDGGTPDADIDAPEAWDITTGSNEVVIAVIDSGVDLGHEDLAANIWTNPGEIPGNGIDDDNNGFIDDVHGWDFSSNDNDPSPAGGGCLGHGTHVAGTIGAIGDNGIGVTGVNWNVKIMPLKAFQPILEIFCAASDADLIAAIQYHTMMGVRISNNSWGGTSPNLAMFSAIRASNSVFVAAAGNGGPDAIGDNNDATPHYPSSYGLDNIVAVAATDRDDNRAFFSNYGHTTVDLGAPGLPILSTLPNNNYGNLFGTSMATPHVTGVAGLLLAQDPTLTNNEIVWRILNSTDNTGLPVLTGGRLNAYNALQYGLSMPAVTVDMSPLGPTEVSPGAFFLFRISVSNNEANPVDMTFKIYAQFDNGFNLLLFQSSGPLDTGATINRTLLRRMPPSFTPGTTFRLFGQAETTTSFDEDWVEYTVVPLATNLTEPHKIYLPLILAE